MNFPGKVIQETQKITNLPENKSKAYKDKGPESHTHPKLDLSRDSSDNLFQRCEQTNSCEPDPQYQQNHSLLSTEKLASVYNVTTGNLNTLPTQTLNADQVGEFDSSLSTSNPQLTIYDSGDGSVCEDSEEYFSHDDDENLSPFNINFILNPDPKEYTLGSYDVQRGESSKTLTSDVSTQDTTNTSSDVLSTSLTSATEFQKLKFVHFQNSLNARIEEKGYRCAICQREFQRPSTLRTHMYSHTGEKPFACTFEGCTKRFSVESNMRRHLRLHFTPNQRARSPRRRKTWVHTFTHHYNP